VEAVESVGVFLVSERSHRLLTGRLLERVAALLDGRRTVEQIIDALAGEVGAAEVYFVLGELEQKGYLVYADDAVAPESGAFWEEAQSGDGHVPPQRLAARVAVAACGAGSAEHAAAVTRCLRSIGIADGQGPSMLDVIVTDDYLRAELDEENRRALASGTPYLLVKPVGTRLWVGPLVDPRRTACWECLAERLRHNRPIDLFIRRSQGRALPVVTARAALATTAETAAHIAATEAAKWLVTGRSRVTGNVLTVDTLSWDTELHPVTRRPQCPACGEPRPAGGGPVPIALVSRPKQFTADGGHRTCSPEETVRRQERHISPITGAISGLIRTTAPGDDVLHAYMAGHNFALGLHTMSLLRKSLRSHSGGKGATDVQAKASAIGEALERYSGVYQGDEPRRRATLAAMGEAAIRPNDCMLYSEAQYRDRAAINRQDRQFHFVPAPFDDDAEVDWTPLWSLTHERARYLPSAYLYYGYNDAHGLDVRHGDGLAWADSNGNAAGNTLEEAIVQGFMEVVERDSVALWWFSRVRRPRVDLTSFDEPYFARLAEYLSGRGRSLWLLDITADLGIPCFAAVSRREDSTADEQVVVGFGAHFEARLAALRALTEVNQFLAAFDSVGENLADGLSFDPAAVEWWSTATLANQPYLVPAEGMTRTASDFTEMSSDDLREDVRTCVRLVRQSGMELLVLDQTRPDIGLPVVKVVVPGMRHFWARLAPGRLYDVPVALGWIPRRLEEHELNPVPVFF
jgi:ribosomal protein S12 methylthiotransferase accessory factor